MPSFAVVAPRWDPIWCWQVHGPSTQIFDLNQNVCLNNEVVKGSMNEVKTQRHSQISTEQNEQRTAWRDKEVIENEAVSRKRCQAKNKKIRVSPLPRPMKPAQHHINITDRRQTLHSGASRHNVQPTTRFEREKCAAHLQKANGPPVSLARKAVVDKLETDRRSKPQPPALGGSDQEGYYIRVARTVARQIVVWEDAGRGHCFLDWSEVGGDFEDGGRSKGETPTCGRQASLK
ncbi:hypothetical protein B0H16DRAFT_1468243 [Mycena metata]|uniref:Uncharacterized protein n=1 Tax=Mycena metata TaxID=1033252 RepID=A0AAD7MW43_9AGAR|nr:hypothetical protein B0H16DRAFT_1468243 [Mycena metata]